LCACLAYAPCRTVGKVRQVINATLRVRFCTLRCQLRPTVQSNANQTSSSLTCQPYNFPIPLQPGGLLPHRVGRKLLSNLHLVRSPAGRLQPEGEIQKSTSSRSPSPIQPTLSPPTTPLLHLPTYYITYTPCTSYCNTYTLSTLSKGMLTQVQIDTISRHLSIHTHRTTEQPLLFTAICAPSCILSL
jgi:hypothetical protein